MSGSEGTATSRTHQQGVYAVDVTVSDHDSLRLGVTERPWCPGAPGWHRVLVWAASDSEARLVAAQMASATSGMCTSAVLVSWPADDFVSRRPH